MLSLVYESFSCLTPPTTTYTHTHTHTHKTTTEKTLFRFDLIQNEKHIYVDHVTSIHSILLVHVRNATIIHLQIQQIQPRLYSLQLSNNTKRLCLTRKDVKKKKVWVEVLCQYAHFHFSTKSYKHILGRFCWLE